MFRTILLGATSLLCGSMILSATVPAVAKEPATGFEDCRLPTGTQDNEDRIIRYHMDDAKRMSERADSYRADAERLRGYARHYAERGDQAQADWFNERADFWEDRADMWEDTVNAKVNEAFKVLNCHTYSTVPIVPREVSVQSPGKPAAEPKKAEAPKAEKPPEKPKPVKKTAQKAKKTKEVKKVSSAKKPVQRTKPVPREPRYAQSDGQAAAVLGNMLMQNLIGAGLQYGLAKQHKRLHRQYDREVVEHRPRKHRKRPAQLGDTTFTGYTVDPAF
jgi:outer membrane biosynthesis protein TonB